MQNSRNIDFSGISAQALSQARAIVTRWLPQGCCAATEWVALNPKRSDRPPGSFRVNLHTRRWSDFATGDSGGDLISLAAYLFDLNQAQAALRLAHMLGTNAYNA